MDILFCLMDQLKTRKEIARRLGMPVYSVQLYLQRLVNAGLVKEENEVAINGEVEKNYYLISDEIEIMNRIQSSAMEDDERRRTSSAYNLQYYYLFSYRNTIYPLPNR